MEDEGRDLSLNMLTIRYACLISDANSFKKHLNSRLVFRKHHYIMSIRSDEI